ncbi:MAG: hypothetical protein MI920_36535, partial [Kiloniellales bacterium]|nr:hypothetical protein [Kiloniellales bacterium]
VDGSEVLIGGAVIDSTNDVVGTNEDTPVNLNLTLALGPDSTDQGSTPADVSQGDEDGSAAGDSDSESVTQVTVLLDQDATLTFTLGGAPAPLVEPQGGGITLYTFNTAGLNQGQVSDLVASFSVVPQNGNINDVAVRIETTTVEAATTAGGGSAGAGDVEVTEADNRDVDVYELTVDLIRDPSGDITVGGDPNAVLKEDTQSSLRLAASVGDPSDPGEILTQVVLDFGQPFDGANPALIQVDQGDITAALNANPAVASFNINGPAGTITIVFNDGTTAAATTNSLTLDFDVQAPLNSDVDLNGITVSVSARDTESGATATGGSSNDIAVDAVVDGTELFLNNAFIDSNNNTIEIDVNSAGNGLGLSLDLDDQTSQAGASPDLDAAFTQGQADNDGTERVNQIVITLVLVAGASAGT